MKLANVMVFLLALFCCGCGSSGPTFDKTDTKGSVDRMVAGMPEEQAKQFRMDCMVAATGECSLIPMGKAMQAQGGADKVFDKLHGMTAGDITKKAAEIRAKARN